MSYARAMIRIVLGGLVARCSPSPRSTWRRSTRRGPKGVDVGVVGTPAQAAQLQSRARRSARAARSTSSASTPSAAARAALLDTGVHAVVVLPGPRSSSRGALGIAPTETVADGAARMRRPARAVEDLRPLPPGDRRGLSSLFTVIAHADPEPGVRRAAVACSGARCPPARAGRRCSAYAVGAGLVAAFNVDVLVGALRRPLPRDRGRQRRCSRSPSARRRTGSGASAGRPGSSTAVLLLLLLGVSSAGGAVTYEFEPGFYGARLAAAAARRGAHRGAQRPVLRLRRRRSRRCSSSPHGPPAASLRPARRALRATRRRSTR